MELGWEDVKEIPFTENTDGANGEPFPALYNSQDWLNANHFDYRGLIKKNLALEAPEGMYKIN